MHNHTLLHAHNDIHTTTQLFSADELVDLFCGSEILTAKTFASHLVFDPSIPVDGAESNVKHNLLRYLEGASEGDLGELLRFATGTLNFSNRRPRILPRWQDPHNAEGNTVWVCAHEDPQRLPFGQSCFRELMLPDGLPFETFEEKLRLAVREGNLGGFQDE